MNKIDEHKKRFSEKIHQFKPKMNLDQRKDFFKEEYLLSAWNTDIK